MATFTSSTLFMPCKRIFPMWRQLCTSWMWKVIWTMFQYKHRMMTSSNGTFSALPVTDEFPAQRPVTRSFDGFFDLRLNKCLNKQSWGWWFETPSWPLWRHCNGLSSHRYFSYEIGIPIPVWQHRYMETTHWVPHVIKLNNTVEFNVCKNDVYFAFYCYLYPGKFFGYIFVSVSVHPS